MEWNETALAPMRYGEFTWPYNPQIYSIEYARVMGNHKMPFGDYVLQDLGRSPRIMKGSGEFVGEDAYIFFGQLANMFYEGGTHWLSHPLWQGAAAFFVDLKLEQIPQPNYVKYSFTFWEDIEVYEKKITLVEERDFEEGLSVESSSGTVHIVVSGENMWVIAKKYGISLAELIALNPQIRNPNLIYPNQEIYVK